MESYFSSKEYINLLEKYRKIFKLNGGAMETGVSSIIDDFKNGEKLIENQVEVEEERGSEKECRLVIDLEVSRVLIFIFLWRWNSEWILMIFFLITIELS